jgi:hypothetical protein
MDMPETTDQPLERRPILNRRPHQMLVFGS